MRGLLFAILAVLACLRLPAQDNAAPQTHDETVQTYNGMAALTTSPFKVDDQWELRWTSPRFREVKLTVYSADGAVVAGTAGSGRGVIYLAKGGSYFLQIEVPGASPGQGGAGQPPNPAPGGGFSGIVQGTDNDGGTQPQPNPYASPSLPQTPWQVAVVEVKPGNGPQLPSLALNGAGGSSIPMVGIVYVPPTESTTDSSASAPPTPSPPRPGGAAPVTLTDAQSRAIVLIKGDNAEGTGFLVKLDGGPAVVTNLHVLANNPNVQITTSSGISIKALGLKGAQDRDLALIPIQDGDYSYLDVAADVGATAQNGDQVITPGNSEGGEVMLNTMGKILGIGPQRVEIDNPIYHGNSGGPIFHPKSGKVLGVVTEAMKVDTSDELDKASSQSSNSAISGTMRYFGLRLDNVPVWETYDWRRFQTETLFLDQFHHQSRCLDSFLNGSAKGNSGGSGDFATLYLSDEKIKAANEDFYQQANGSDSSQRLDALRGLLLELHNVADSNMDDIQNPNNFYSFDRQRARDETDYRKQLQAELDSIGNDVSRLGSLARKNN